MSLDRRSLIAAGLALAASPADAQAAPIARTTHGRVRGAQAGDVLSFKGIRYGAPSARFQAPQRPGAWRGVRDALTYGPTCPQRGLDGETQSEDCLFLNVWTPALRARRPVLVYIHGGAYNTGSGSSAVTDGARLSAYGDVVVVTLNHRLNAFGYCYLAARGLPDSGNAGQLDLVLALEWVRDNIANFGGDPSCVTVFGQSGGGAKIATLMAMPAAAGLFHRAFTMSGQQVTASGPLNATRRTGAYLDALGLGAAHARELVSIPAARLVDALQIADPVLGFGSIYFGPVLDERHLTRHPFYPNAPRQSRAIPMMIGNTRDETRGFVGADRSLFALTWDELPARLAGAMRVDIVLPERVVSGVSPPLSAATAPSDVYFAASTAARSWRGALDRARSARRSGRRLPTPISSIGARRREAGIFGVAPHARYPARLRQSRSFGMDIGERQPRRRAAMSRTMMDALLRFARTGDPGWAPYTLPDRATMLFDNSTTRRERPRAVPSASSSRRSAVRPARHIRCASRAAASDLPRR
jgi:para-nitrobenzyl esterase